MADLDALVVGAGVVGLAIARALSKRMRNVAVVDRHGQFGMETSSRNSEVIHAGIYYRQDSKKALLCRQGRNALYQYCASREINHKRCGKIIVGSGAGAVDGLKAIESQAVANGVDTLSWLDGAQVRRMEPGVRCDLALHSPETGIIDSHALMEAYAADLEAAGGTIALKTDVNRIELGGTSHKVYLKGEKEPVRTSRLVNAAGLWAEQLARNCIGLNADCIPQLKFARGVYFVPDGGRLRFDRLIYPLPGTASLGVHATIDLQGAVRFGPDVEWIDANDDYQVNADRVDAFRRSIASYYPAIEDVQLLPGYAGIRPKLAGPGEPPADFQIDGPAKHGAIGLVNLFGIESPGLTSSLAIAEYVSELLP